MKNLFCILVLMLTFQFSFAQEDTTPRNEEIIQNSGPEGNWKVHKKYDQQGNLIAMDSVYSYHSINGKPATKAETDSLMQAFRKQFASDDFFKGFFSSDSISGNHQNNSLNSEINSDMLSKLFGQFNNGDLQSLLKNFESSPFDDSFFSNFFSQHQGMQEMMQQHMKEIQEMMQQNSRSIPIAPQLKKEKKPETPEAPIPTKTLQRA